jgi:hypothetical protein
LHPCVPSHFDKLSACAWSRSCMSKVVVAAAAAAAQVRHTSAQDLRRACRGTAAAQRSGGSTCMPAQVCMLCAGVCWHAQPQLGCMDQCLVVACCLSTLIEVLNGLGSCDAGGHVQPTFSAVCHTAEVCPRPPVCIMGRTDSRTHPRPINRHVTAGHLEVHMCQDGSEHL